MCRRVPPGEAPAVVIKTAHLHLSESLPPVTNLGQARITRRIFPGDLVQCFLDWQGTELRARQLPLRLFEEGHTVYLSVAPEHAVLLRSDRQPVTEGVRLLATRREELSSTPICSPAPVGADLGNLAVDNWSL